MIEHDDEMFSILLFLWTDDSVIKESENQVVVVLSEDVVHGTGKKMQVRGNLCSLWTVK